MNIVHLLILAAVSCHQSLEDNWSCLQNICKHAWEKRLIGLQLSSSVVQDVVLELVEGGTRRMFTNRATLILKAYACAYEPLPACCPIATHEHNMFK